VEKEKIKESHQWIYGYKYVRVLNKGNWLLEEYLTDKFGLNGGLRSDTWAKIWKIVHQWEFRLTMNKGES